MEPIYIGKKPAGWKWVIFVVTIVAIAIVALYASGGQFLWPIVLAGAAVLCLEIAGIFGGIALRDLASFAIFLFIVALFTWLLIRAMGD